MLSPAVFGISNSGVNLAIDLLILFLVVIWLALVYWTYADARAAVARGREMAGPSGAVVVTGSIYLIADVIRPAVRNRASML